MKVADLNINLENIDRVYSGKRGCMCGCQGKYTTPQESTRSVKIMLKKVLSHPDVKVDKSALCAYVETATERTIAVYFKQI